MHLIDADALLNGLDADLVPVEAIKNAPAVDAVVLPFKPGDDCFWISSETLEINCEKGGIAAVVVYADSFDVIDLDGEQQSPHTQWCCLSREEAEKLRENLLEH